MELTKEEIIDRMKAEMPFALHSMLRPYIYEAMEIYAGVKVAEALAKQLPPDCC